MEHFTIDGPIPFVQRMSQAETDCWLREIGEAADDLPCTAASAAALDVAATGSALQALGVAVNLRNVHVVDGATMGLTVAGLVAFGARSRAFLAAGTVCVRRLAPGACRTATGAAPRGCTL